MDLAGPDGFEDGFVFGVVALEDVLAEDAGDDVAADTDEFILGVEVVEGGVFGVVELVDDELADVLGVLAASGLASSALPSAVAIWARAMRAP